MTQTALRQTPGKTENKMNMKMIKRFRTVLMMAIVIMLAIPCAAQSDGGGKKKKKVVKTEQTTSDKTKRKQQGQAQIDGRGKKNVGKTEQTIPDKAKRGQAEESFEKEKGMEETPLDQVKEDERQLEEEVFQQNTCSINGHEWVDLGLSVKWATCNVGATSPGDYGDYYAWGEISPKSRYDWSNCFDCLDSKGKRWGVYKQGSIYQIIPTSSHDPARQNWGGSWRMPTESEIKELKDKCIWKWSVRDGHDGYLVIGPNGKSIFLPAGGYKDGTGFKYVGKYGGYWSSSLSTSNSCRSRSLCFSDGHYNVYNIYRRYGQSVRPVTE